MASLRELFNLKGRAVFITGGSGYLGTSMCEALAENGADIAIAETNAATCEQLVARLRGEFGVRAVGLACDIRQPESIRDALKAAADQLGGVHVLINNAYAGNKNRFETITYEEWNANIEIGLSAPFYAVKEAFEYLKATRGVVLNTASMYGHIAPDYRLYEGNPHAVPASYNAAKGGILQLTRYLASFLSPHGIRVNALSPGAFPHAWQQADNEFHRRLSEKAPLGRVGQPDDVKGAVALLCSDAGKFMTGQNVCVDGGWTIW
ncbi:MAG: SDR family oxidoreductase [Planctomycetota bacterium]|nr:SDR family oxidoreductase [Planctomycetota bacterium]